MSLARLVVIVMLGALACRSPDDPFGDGIAVGNPGQTLTARVVPGSGIRETSGRLDVGNLSVIGCDGAPGRAVVAEVALPLDGPAKVELPVGRWCGLEVVPSAPVRIAGVTQAGGTFDLRVDVGTFTVVAPRGFDAAAGPWVLVLGPRGWLTPSAIGLDGAGSVVLGPPDPGHDALSALVGLRSRLVRDQDGDGTADPLEPDVATGAGFPGETDGGEDSDDDDGDTGDAEDSDDDGAAHTASDDTDGTDDTDRSRETDEAGDSDTDAGVGGSGGPDTGGP